jgi:ribonuclease P protein component
MTAPAPPPIAGLKARRQFLHVAQGRKAAGRFALLQMRESAEGHAEVRFGLTASKKVGNAVLRNRARRRLRAAMRALLAEFGRPGHDYVAVARTATTQANWSALLDDLRRLFIRLAPERAHEPTNEARSTSPPVTAGDGETGPSSAA